jgi:tetratricopeptide (TPR) repeat protein
MVKLAGTLPQPLDGLSEISGTIRADARGNVEDASHSESAPQRAAAAAAAMSELAAAGDALGLARLDLLLVRGAATSTVTALRGDEILLLALDPSKSTAGVEKALQSWAATKDAPAGRAPAANASGPPPPPLPAASGGLPPGAGKAAAPARPVRPAPTQARPAASREAGDPWAGLRYSLARGLLTEAAVRRRQLAEAAPASGGREALSAAEIDASTQLLVQGIGSVLAGDGVGGARILEPLGAETQKSLSFRWLALYWSGRAALKSGSSTTARTQLMPALLIAKGLDADAVAVTQWFAGELLAHDAEHGKALSYLAAARVAFEKAEDPWGIARTWLAEARVLASIDREAEGIAAARRARAADPTFEDPIAFLVRRSLMRNDLAEAEGMLGQLPPTSAERMRSLLDAIRRSLVSPEDAREFLAESDALPNARSIRALERIAQAAPRFVQAREALAWMLLKVGKYAEANTLFRGLLATPLTRADRTSVMLGLGCIEHAQQAVKGPEGRSQGAVVAGSATPAPAASDPGKATPVPGASAPSRSSQLAGGSVFSGQLSVFALPDVIEFVRSARRTGRLVCSSAGGLAEVLFRAGRITGAASPGAPRLGEILTGARKISPVALTAMSRAQPADTPDHVLGERLVQEGAADASVVGAALRRKVEAVLLEVLQWKDGEFAFNREGEGAPAGPDALAFDAQDVLLTVVKQMDEDSRSHADRGARA